jgi:hypothetical protein
MRSIPQQLHGVIRQIEAEVGSADFEDLCRQTSEGRSVLANLSAPLECYLIALDDDK